MDHHGGVFLADAGEAQSGGGGFGNVLGENGELVATAVVVPIVVVAVVTLVMWGAIRVWRGRYGMVYKEGEYEDVDMNELRNKIDEGQKEEEEQLDVGDLEDLQL